MLSERRSLSDSKCWNGGHEWVNARCQHLFMYCFDIYFFIKYSCFYFFIFKKGEAMIFLSDCFNIYFYIRYLGIASYLFLYKEKRGETIVFLWYCLYIYQIFKYCLIFISLSLEKKVSDDFSIAFYFPFIHTFCNKRDTMDPIFYSIFKRKDF